MKKVSYLMGLFMLLAWFHDPKYEPWILKMSPHKIEPWKKKFTLDGEDRQQK